MKYVTQWQSLLTALFLYSCNTSLRHHNMMEEIHSASHPLSKFDNTILKREKAIELFSDFKPLSSGGAAVVYDSGDGSVFRVGPCSATPYVNGTNKTTSELRKIKYSNKELPIVDMYAIFKIDTDHRYFKNCQIINSLSAKPHSEFVNDDGVFSSILVMQKVELYSDLKDVNPGPLLGPEILDFALVDLFLQSYGIEITDQPKIRNLGYILQDKPVQYTFKIKNELRTYEVVGQLPQEGTNGLYKKTIMIDYDGWKVNRLVSDDYLEQKLEALVKDGKIIRLNTSY